MTKVLDARVTGGPDHESLVEFVDGLVATGDARAAVSAARKRIAEDVCAGQAPAGLRRLAESLSTPVPPPRRPADEPETLAGVVPEEGRVVLSGAGDDELVEALGALVERGMRIVVTGTDPAAPKAVRDRLPSALAAHTTDTLDVLAPPDLRRLRRLLATTTPERRVRGRQELPDPAAMPDPTDIAGCCERAARTVAGVDSEEARLVPELLRDLDAERRAAVTQVARCVGRTVGALHASPNVEWLRPVAYQLVHNVHRPEFEQLQTLAAQQRDGLAQAADDPSVTEVGPVPEGTPRVVAEYRAYLSDGGRARTYFRPPVQREADEVLGQFRIGDATPQSVDQLAAVERHLDLSARQDEIDRICRLLEVPTPQGAAGTVELIEALDVAAASARSVGSLRHDVLFLQERSPVSVPDLPAAERVASAIVDYDEQGDPAEAADELDRLADELAGRSPAMTMAPEHERAVEALRAHDAQAYATSLEELDAARRERADQQRCDELLTQLRASAPQLAAAWSADSEAGTAGFGLLCCAPADGLLAALPPADSADLVVVLGAGALPADALLLTAVAPRLVAVVGDEARPRSGTTLLEVLNQASARFLRGRGDVAAKGPAKSTAKSTAKGTGTGSGKEPGAAVPVPAQKGAKGQA